MKIIGVSAFYHDSAAALIVDGKIISAAQEERFTRKKHDANFPTNAINFCLKNSHLSWDDIDCLVFYDKPWLKFERILETYRAMAPRGISFFHKSLPVWIKEKLLLTNLIHKFIPKTVKIKYSNHHLSHAAAAFYPSPFLESAILTMDGVGEWSTATIALGKNNKIEFLKEMRFPHSVGLLYSSFTYFCGFKINSGEYKLMGLAPFGNATDSQTQEYISKIKENMLSIFEDGSLWLNPEYFNYTHDLKMINTRMWENLFNLKIRLPEDILSQDFCNLAYAIQNVTEEIVLKIAKHCSEITISKNLCLAGGVALNCVANGKLLKENIFENIWIQPAAGDAGNAIGAALAFYYLNNPDREKPESDQMNGSFLGPEYTHEEIKSYLQSNNIIFNESLNDDHYFATIAGLISENFVVGWFQGRMEFGPRSLGNRSILANPLSPETQKKLNLKIKYRESFRPFAPSVCDKYLSEYFETDTISPYMLFVSQLKSQYVIEKPKDFAQFSLEKKLYTPRSLLPAITHLDYSARVQSVHQSTNMPFYNLIEKFKEITGYPMLVNTSFNVRGEPIVCSPDDATRCFFQTEMDVLAIGRFLIKKSEQKEETKNIYKNLKRQFGSD